MEGNPDIPCGVDPGYCVDSPAALPAVTTAPSEDVCHPRIMFCSFLLALLFILGSHIMQDAGVYILQWHNQDDPGEFLPSISGHKAQLMYFYETLSSVHYRGSMMSLQSAISTKSEATSFLSR